MASKLEVEAALGVDDMVVWERVLGIVGGGKKEKAGGYSSVTACLSGG